MVFSFAPIGHPVHSIVIANYSRGYTQFFSMCMMAHGILPVTPPCLTPHS